MRPNRWICTILLLLSADKALSDFDVYGFAAGRVGQVQSTPSWLEGGFGRLDNGSDGTQDTSSFANLEAQVAVDWSINESFLLHLQAIGRAEDSEDSLDDFGIIEAYARLQLFDRDTDTLSVTLGQKFFPSSLENVDDLWQSRYTLSYSSWNSWIAHEFRPIGVELVYNHHFSDGDRLGVVLNAFQGNDSSGAELAWGGWRQSQRLSSLGEVLPLPDLISLRDGQNFADQRNDGSKPFGPDLDNNVGYAAQLNYRTQKFTAKLSYADNNGDRELHHSEYAWDTEFSVLGLQYAFNDHWVLLGEVADGSTGMGPSGTSVDVDFQTAYLLLSWSNPAHRISFRAETFELEDTDGIVTDNSEDGESFTLAYFYTPGTWRFGIEYLDTQVDRIAASQSGFDQNNDGEQLTFEIRYVF